MKSIKIIFIAWVVSLMLMPLSCMKEDGFSDGVGRVSLSISNDESLIERGTKADNYTFRVVVKNASGVQVATYEDHHELANNPLMLPAGTYTISASTGELTSAGEIPEAVFGKPVYIGETQVDVVAGKTSIAEVVCSLSQVKVSVEFDQSVTDNFPTVILTVTNGDSFENTYNNLIFSSNNGSIDNAGYFNCTGKLSYKLYLVNKDNYISDGAIQNTITNVQPREHYKLQLTVSDSDEGSAIVPGISGDDSTNDTEHNVLVNLNKKKKPVITTNGFNMDDVVYVSEGSEAPYEMDITSQTQLTELSISHSSALLLEMGIPNRVDMLNTPSDVKSACESAGLVWTSAAAFSMTPAVASVHLNMTGLMKRLPLGDYAITFSAVDAQAQFIDRIFSFKVMPANETSTLSVEPWGKHAFVYGKYNTVEQPAGIGFEYRKSVESSWIKVTGGVEISGNGYSAKLAGLEPDTEYIVRSVSDKESSNELTFTTLKAEQIANMNFDSWVKSGKHWYASETVDGKVWDSGNEGANMLSEVNPTAPEENFVVSGKAARLETKAVFGVLAAGSVYTGDFLSTVGTSGAKLNFGTSYTCKPITLKGHYNYTPKAIDKVKAPYTDLAGSMDSFQIYVVLADWPEGYFTVNTSEGIFVNPENDTHVIGYGSIEGNTATGDAYQPFEIPIEYKAGTGSRVPTTCVIVCSASKYGDYFTGGVGSVLYVDEFEFTF